VIRSRSDGVKGRDGLGASIAGTSTRAGGGGAGDGGGARSLGGAGAAGGGPGCKAVASDKEGGARTLARVALAGCGFFRAAWVPAAAGVRAITRSPGPHNATITDTFSLKGFSKAYDAINKACPK